MSEKDDLIISAEAVSALDRIGDQLNQMLFDRACERTQREGRKRVLYADVQAEIAGVLDAVQRKWGVTLEPTGAAVVTS